MKSLISKALETITTAKSVVFTERTQCEGVVKNIAVVFKNDGRIFRLTFDVLNRKYLLEVGTLFESSVKLDNGRYDTIQQFAAIDVLPMSETFRQRYHSKLLRARMI